MELYHWNLDHPGLPEGSFGYLKEGELPRSGVATFKEVLKHLGADQNQKDNERSTTETPAPKEKEKPIKPIKAVQ